MKRLPQTEAEFMAAVQEAAAMLGWLCYHTHDSRRSTAGFPDLVLVRGERLIFAELKTETGKTSREQDHWIAALTTVALGVQAFSGPGRILVRLWTPRDWPLIEGDLGRR